VLKLGTGVAVSIVDLAEICRKITGSTARVLPDDGRVRPASSEVQVLLSDPRGAADAIGWRPTTTLLDGLTKAASWLSTSAALTRAGDYHR
jgi:nucleoside-diphosphate-sugar epimerase